VQAFRPGGQDLVKKIIVIVMAVLLVAGGGAGGWWWWSQRAQAATADDHGDGHSNTSKAKKGHASSETGAVVLEPFLVNLADKDASRFLRVSLQLVVDHKELAEAMNAKGEEGAEHAVTKARLRSSILELLTTKTSDALVTTEGKAALKKEIASRATGILGEAEVVDVLFTDFVVQF
jgi:flagellar FliL protein